MRAKIWGCRGSLATPGPDTLRYGGNTSCVQVSLGDGTQLVLDAGTGIRLLGFDARIEEARELHLFLSHLHLDHLEGLGFFRPLWRRDIELHIWGPPSPVSTLGQRIAQYMSPPLFPIHLLDVPSQPILHDAREECRVGSAVVRAFPVVHQGPAVGYRIEDGGRTLTYIPDHEPSHGGNLRDFDPSWISGYPLAADADVLLHDSQYTEEEYPQRLGWGHSSVEHVVSFARVSRVKKLYLFHHDPLHSDADLEAHEKRARELWGSDGEPPELAYEGMEIDLS